MRLETTEATAPSRSAARHQAQDGPTLLSMSFNFAAPEKCAGTVKGARVAAKGSRCRGEGGGWGVHADPRASIKQVRSHIRS